MPKPVDPIVSATTPSPDPRVGLKPGHWDAAQAAWNMRMLSTTPPKGRVLGATHSDLAFSGNLVIMGNYNGFEIFDISNPAKPVLMQTYLCPASQNDVSVYRNLLFMSSEATNSRADCGFEGVPEPVSKLRVRGIRVFDISDVKKPKLVTTVQTCRGSHTHTVVTKQGDDANVFVYVSGTAGVRSADEVPGCQDGGYDDPNTARFRLEVVKVPVRAPVQAAIVSSPRIFQGLPVPPRNEERSAQDQRDREQAQREAQARGERGRGGQAPGAGGAGRGNQTPTGPNQCHDITVYPEIGLAGGACAGLGLLLDIRDPEHPVRIDAVSDANMSFWHSATFNNDGTKIIFTDEWGGGTRPRCRATDLLTWGADAVFDIVDKKLKFGGYFKLPAPQGETENCVAHNGSIIPVPGRDIMVQAWYQGGVSVFDFTDSASPVEIAYFDRGPIDAKNLILGGYWSTYWYNGRIYGSEISRGVDIFRLLPSDHLTQNEIDAASSVRLDTFNAQMQPKVTWPATVTVARAYLDQLNRTRGIDPARATAVKSALSKVEKDSAPKAAVDQLDSLAKQLESDATSASGRDADRMRALAGALKARAARLRG